MHCIYKCTISIVVAWHIGCNCTVSCFVSSYLYIAFCIIHQASVHIHVAKISSALNFWICNNKSTTKRTVSATVEGAPIIFYIFRAYLRLFRYYFCCLVCSYRFVPFAQIDLSKLIIFLCIFFCSFKCLRSFFLLNHMGVAHSKMRSFPYISVSIRTFQFLRCASI